jgi:hypothetical protein
MARRGDAHTRTHDHAQREWHNGETLTHALTTTPKVDGTTGRRSHTHCVVMAVVVLGSAAMAVLILGSIAMAVLVLVIVFFSPADGYSPRLSHR